MASNAINTATARLHSLKQDRASIIKIMDRDPESRALLPGIDSEIAAIEARLRELRPPSPREQQAELEAKIAADEAQLRKLGEQRSAAVVSKIQRDPAGAASLKRIEAQIAETEARLRALREQHGKLQQRIAAERAENRRKDAEAKPQRIAELHQERVGLAETVTNAAHTLAAAFKAIQANGAELSQLLEDQSARNFFSAARFAQRANNAFARAFALDPNQPLNAGNNLFGLASHAIGPQVHWTLPEWEQPALDDLVPFYTEEAHAEAARARLELRGCATIIVPLPHAFMLARFEHVFGDETTARRAAARAAAGGAAPMAVRPHDGGYVLIPERFFAEAA
jgi:hypothetical protein